MSDYPIPWGEGGAALLEKALTEDSAHQAALVEVELAKRGRDRERLISAREELRRLRALAVLLWGAR